MIHMNHFRLVLERFSTTVSGLRREDVSRQDRQNFTSAQRLIKQPVIECLEKIQMGSG